jgi:hypothetical protein
MNRLLAAPPSWLDAMRERFFRLRDRLVADPRFRDWAARFPLTRPLARRRARALVDLNAGFVYSQVLYTGVKLGLFARLVDGAKTVDELAPALGLRADATQRLLDAATALKLCELRPGARYGLGIHGASLVATPAVEKMVLHHHMLYRDLSEDEFLRRAEVHVEALNHGLRNVPGDRVRLHICWGNYEGPHTRDIALGKVLPVVLKAKPRGLLFEGANPRHAHEWTVWNEIKAPDDYVLIPGCLDSTTNFVEHPELIRQRLERYTSIVGTDRVIAGTDCGFSTFAGFGVVDPDIVWAKMASLVEGASAV